MDLGVGEGGPRGDICVCIHTHTHTQLIHFVVIWQKLTQHCKATIIPIKNEMPQFLKVK